MNSQYDNARGRMGEAHRRLFTDLEETGYRGCVVSILRLRDLQEKLDESHGLAYFDEEFYQERLGWFVFSQPDHLPEARSIIIVAYSHPQTRVTFSWNGKPVDLIVPPTYLHGNKGDDRIRELLMASLQPSGYQVVEALLPKKLLAVCSGLGDYGKNNLCYVEGMGSFLRLAAYYSDLPCEEDNWREPQMMVACKKCSACVTQCPTGAISKDRFLVRAELCITYHNEKPGNVPFPAWIDSSWHNCLVGCMTCQRSCPKNKDRWYEIEDGARFSQEETAMLLKGTALEQLPKSMVEKLEQFDLIDFHDIFPRNLGLFLHRAAS